MTLIQSKLTKYETRVIDKIINCKIGNIGCNSFTRERNMCFKDFIVMMLGRRGLTTSVDLLEFSKRAEKKRISKQDFSKQRKNISEKFFADAFDETVKDFYENYKYSTYKGFILVGIDGSKTILPRVKELEEYYGTANANNSQQKCVQCNISGCYDLLNHIMLDIEVAPYASDERELAVENIKKLKKKLSDKKFIIIFDRGYPSINMLNFLEENKIFYIIRMQDSTYEKEKKQMKSDDEIVDILLNKDRLSGKMSEETYNKLKEMKYYRTRFVKYELNTGNYEWLVTNIPKDMISSNKIGELYFKRWEIEKAFDTLKNKLELENMSGKSRLTVMQDIYSTMIIYNMVATLEFILDEVDINSVENKHTYKLNENALIGGFMQFFIEIMISENPKKIKQFNELLVEFAISQKTAIIDGRSNPRGFKGGSLKCKVNMKRGF